MANEVSHREFNRVKERFDSSWISSYTQDASENYKHKSHAVYVKYFLLIYFALVFFVQFFVQFGSNNYSHDHYGNRNT